MSLVAKKGANFDPVPEGSHHAVCFGVIDLGVQVNTKFNNSSPKVQILWELVNEVSEYEGEETRRYVSKDYTLSLSDKAKLREHLESWRGKSFTEAELQGFDLTSILGKNCLIQVLHSDSGYANVASVMSLPKGMPVEESEREHIIFEFNEKQPIEGLADLPEFIQNKIKNSPSFVDVFGEIPEEKIEKRNVQRDARPKVGSGAASSDKRQVTRRQAPASEEPRTDVF